MFPPKLALEHLEVLVRLQCFFEFFLLLFWTVLGLSHCTWAFSSCTKQGLLFTVVCGPLVVVASLVACQLWHTGLAAPKHVGSSQTRDQTCVPCVGRGILSHWTTKEAFFKFLKIFDHTMGHAGS